MVPLREVGHDEATLDGAEMKNLIYARCNRCSARIPNIDLYNSLHVAEALPEIRCKGCGAVTVIRGNRKLVAVMGLGIYCALTMLCLKIQRLLMGPLSESMNFPLLVLFMAGIPVSIFLACVNFLHFNEKGASDERMMK